ncbi:MAG TPA: TMEM175 family protein [Acidimicrobiia bacterium]|nr:TMEM175 family protein [Acidimicrobiia bacterium]
MFSDGVIAIAITLLVLQIKVPHARQGNLLDALLDQWPSYVAFALSFVVIGIMWVSHHSMFERIALVDRKLLFINLLLLMGIAFLPFPTDLVATYVRDGGSNSHIAAAIYSSTMVAIGIAFAGMWLHLVHRPWLLVPGIPPERTRTAFHRSLVGPIVYLLTVGLAFISAEACFVVYALIALYFAAGPSSKVATADDPGELERGAP